MSRRTSTSSRTPARKRKELPPELERPVDVRRLVLIGLAVVAVLVIAVTVWNLVPEGATYGGPLQDPDLGGTSAVGGKRGIGKPLSVGVFLPWNVADEPAVLDRLVPLSASEGIEVVGAGVLPPEAAPVPVDGGWPPEGMAEPPPVHGFAIPPGDGALDAYQLVVGVQATEPGVHSIPGFEIQYHVGRDTYRAVMVQGVWICVPLDQKPACPGKGDIEEQQRELRASLLPLVDAPDR